MAAAASSSSSVSPVVVSTASPLSSKSTGVVPSLPLSSVGSPDEKTSSHPSFSSESSLTESPRRLYERSLASRPLSQREGSVAELSRKETLRQRRLRISSAVQSVSSLADKTKSASSLSLVDRMRSLCTALAEEEKASKAALEALPSAPPARPQSPRYVSVPSKYRETTPKKEREKEESKERRESNERRSRSRFQYFVASPKHVETASDESKMAKGGKKWDVPSRVFDFQKETKSSAESPRSRTERRRAERLEKSIALSTSVRGVRVFPSESQATVRFASDVSSGEKPFVPLSLGSPHSKKLKSEGMAIEEEAEVERETESVKKETVGVPEVGFAPLAPAAAVAAESAVEIREPKKSIPSSSASSASSSSTSSGDVTAESAPPAPPPPAADVPLAEVSEGSEGAKSEAPKISGSSDGTTRSAFSRHIANPRVLEMLERRNRETKSSTQSLS